MQLSRSDDGSEVMRENALDSSSHMAISEPFARYIRTVLNGVPFLSPDAGWRSHMGIAVSHWLERCGYGLHVFTNIAGNKIRFEGCYALYGGDTYVENLPGARAERFESNVFVTLHLNTFAHFWSLAADLMACSEFLPMIGDPRLGLNGAQKNERPFGFLPVVSTNFDILLLAIVGRGPKCPVRTRFALLLRDLMLESVLTHESAHGSLGHLDFLRHTSPGLKTIPSYNPMVQGPIFRALMEFEADTHSARSLAARIPSRARFGLEHEFSLSDETWVMVHLLSRYFVAYTWLVCDLLAGHSPKLDQPPEWQNYPPSSLRMFYSFPAYHFAFRDLYSGGAEIFDAASKKAVLQVNQLINRYKQLAPLALGMDTVRTREYLATLESNLQSLRYYEQLQPYRYYPEENQTRPRTLEAGNNGGNFASRLNEIVVGVDVLRGVLECVMRLPGEKRTN